MARALKTLYNLVLGDRLWHDAMRQRLDLYREMSRDVDLSNPYTLNRFARAYEEEANITEITLPQTTHMGSPISKYYSVQSPSDFRKKREKTLRKVAKLKDL